MVKARKSHQPRDWAKVTHTRSASGFISSLPVMTTAKISGQHGSRHTVIRKFGKNGKELEKPLYSKEAATVSVEELRPEERKHRLLKSLKKQEKRLKRFNEQASRATLEDTSDFRAKAQTCMDLIFEKKKSLKELEELILVKMKRENSKIFNERKKETIEKNNFKDLIRRMENAGEIQHKSKAYMEAHAKFTGASSVDKGKVFASRSEQPRQKRTDNTVQVINKNKKKQFQKKTYTIS